VAVVRGLPALQEMVKQECGWLWWVEAPQPRQLSPAGSTRVTAAEARAQLPGVVVWLRAAWALWQGAAEGREGWAERQRRQIAAATRAGPLGGVVVAEREKMAAAGGAEVRSSGVAQVGGLARKGKAEVLAA